MRKITIFLAVLLVPLSIWASGGKDNSGEDSAAIEASQVTENEQSLLDLAESGDAAGIEKLLKVDINLNATDDSGRTALHAAAETGDADIVAVLLIRGAYSDPLDDIGRTPLLLAVENRHNEVVELLSKSGANIARTDDSGKSPATVALNGAADDMRYLLTAENINESVIKGSPMLHVAAAEGKIDMVDVLIEYGADTSLKNNVGETALDAALSGIVGVNQIGCASTLIRNGSPPPAVLDWQYIEDPLKTGDLDIRFDYGSTALHIAAERGHEGMLRYLINAGVDIEVRDQPGNTPLHVAVRRGYRSIARILLDLGADVDVKDFNGNAPIHESLTASDGHAMTNMLLDRGADPNIQNGGGSTPLHLCILLDADVSAARLLLDRGAAVDPRDRTGNTPLLLAVDYKNREIAELLLSEGADIFAKNNREITSTEGALAYGPEVASWFFTGSRPHETDNAGRSALHLAVNMGSVPETLTVLLQAGADPDLRDFDGESPLHYAVRRKDLPQALTLLENDASLYLENNTGRTPLILAFDGGVQYTTNLLADRLNITDTAGNTPLFLAVEWDYPAIARALLDAGADAGWRNDLGITPLHTAARGDNTVIAEMLLDAGSPPNNFDNMKRTPLHDAVIWGSYDMSRLLIERGADVDAADSEGQTVLHMSAYADNDDVSAWLLLAGAYPNAQDNQGRTPISIAAESDNLDTVKLLLDNGASLQIRDRKGRTPLHAAVAAERVDTASYLIESGSDFYALDANGQTPFHLAILAGPELLDALMTPELARRQDNRGDTVLHIAVEAEAPMATIVVLLNNGADKRIRNALGKTAGEMAADTGQDDIASMLL